MVKKGEPVEGEDDRTGKDWSADEVRRTVAFVISQDGDLPVFFSDDRHVYCDENLSP